MAVHYIATPQHVQQPTPESPLRRSRRHLGAAASGQSQQDTSTSTGAAPTATQRTPHRKRPRVIEIQEEEEQQIVTSATTTPRGKSKSSSLTHSLPAPSCTPTPRAIRAQKRRKLVDETDAEVEGPTIAVPNPLSSISPEPISPTGASNAGTIAPNLSAPQPEAQYTYKTRAGKRKAHALVSSPSSLPSSSPNPTPNLNVYEDDGTSSSGSGSEGRDSQPRALGGANSKKRRRVVRVTTPTNTASPTPQAKSLRNTTTFVPRPLGSSTAVKSKSKSTPPTPSRASTILAPTTRTLRTVRSTTGLITPTTASRGVSQTTPTKPVSKSSKPTLVQTSSNSNTPPANLSDLNPATTSFTSLETPKPTLPVKSLRSTDKSVGSVVPRGINASKALKGKKTEVVKHVHIDSLEEKRESKSDARGKLGHVRRRSARLSGSVEDKKEEKSADADVVPASVNVEVEAAAACDDSGSLTVASTSANSTILTTSSDTVHLQVESTNEELTDAFDDLSVKAIIASSPASTSSGPVQAHTSGSGSLSSPLAPSDVLSSPSLPPSSNTPPSSPITPPSISFSLPFTPTHNRPPPNPFLYAQAQHLAHVKTKPSTPSPLGRFVWVPGSPGSPRPMSMIGGYPSSPQLQPLAISTHVHTNAMTGDSQGYAGGDGFWQERQGYQQHQYHQQQPQQQQTETLYYTQQDLQIQIEPASVYGGQAQSQNQFQQGFVGVGGSASGYGVEQSYIQDQPQSQLQMSYGYSQQGQMQTQGGQAFMLDPAFQSTSTSSWMQDQSSNSSMSMSMPIQLPTTVNMQELTLPNTSSSGQGMGMESMGSMQWYYPSQTQTYEQANQSQPQLQQGFESPTIQLDQQNQDHDQNQERSRSLGFGDETTSSPSQQQLPQDHPHDQHNLENQPQEQVFQSGCVPEGVGVGQVNVGFGTFLEPSSSGSGGPESGIVGFGSSSEGETQRNAEPSLETTESGRQSFRVRAGETSKEARDAGVRMEMGFPSSSAVSDPPTCPLNVGSSISSHTQDPSSSSSVASSSSSSLLSSQAPSASRNLSQTHYSLPLHNAVLYYHQSLARFHEEQETMRQYSTLVGRKQLEEFEREREERRSGLRKIYSGDDVDSDGCGGDRGGREGEERKDEIRKGKQRCDVATYSAHKARGLWAVACKARMYEFARRYSAPLIRDFTECAAREYHVRKGLKYPGKRKGALLSQPQVMDAKPSSPPTQEYAMDEDEDDVDDGEEFMKEQFFKFELFDDDELMDEDDDEDMDADKLGDEEDDEEDEDEDIDMVAEQDASPSSIQEDKENAEPELELDDPNDPSFNPELTMTVKAQQKHSSEVQSARPSTPTEHPTKSTKSMVSMSTFYVPPLQIRIGAESKPSSTSSPSDQPSSSPSPPSPVSSDSPSPPTSPTTPPSPKLIFVQRPILPLPPPKLSIVRPLALRMWNSDPVLAGRGTPSIRALREAWARGSLPTLSRASRGLVYTNRDDTTVEEAFKEIEEEYNSDSASMTAVDEDGDDVMSTTDVESNGESGDIFAPGSSTIYYTNGESQTEQHIESSGNPSVVPAPTLQDDRASPSPTLVAPAIEGTILSSSSSSAIPSENAHPVDDTAVSVVVQDASPLPTSVSDDDTEFGDCASGCCADGKNKLENASSLKPPTATTMEPGHPEQHVPQSQLCESSLSTTHQPTQTAAETHARLITEHTKRIPHRRRAILGRERVLKVYAPPHRSVPPMLPLARRPAYTPPLEVNPVLRPTGIPYHPVTPYSWEGVADAVEVLRYHGVDVGCSTTSGWCEPRMTMVTTQPMPSIGMSSCGDVRPTFNPSSSELSSALG